MFSFVSRRIMMYISDYAAEESLGVGGAVEDSSYSCRARTLVRPFFIIID